MPSCFSLYYVLWDSPSVKWLIGRCRPYLLGIPLSFRSSSLSWLQVGFCHPQNYDFSIRLDSFHATPISPIFVSYTNDTTYSESISLFLLMFQIGHLQGIRFMFLKVLAISLVFFFSNLLHLSRYQTPSPLFSLDFFFFIFHFSYFSKHTHTRFV